MNSLVYPFRLTVYFLFRYCEELWILVVEINICEHSHYM